MTGFVAAFTEGPIDFYKSQLQVQIIRSKQDPNYKRESELGLLRGRVAAGASTSKPGRCTPSAGGGGHGPGGWIICCPSSRQKA